MAEIKQKEENKINKTSIEWVKNPDGTQGITVNSKTGCLNHKDGLCLGGNFPCYAYRLAQGRLFKRYIANSNTAPVFSDGKGIATELPDTFDPFYPRSWPERLEKIRKIKKPTGIFLNDMSDWMGDYWPEEWTRAELQVMRDCPQHRFYLLTKQPQNLIKFSPFPENCWVGVTATNNQAYREALVSLAHIEAEVRFISFEPLLENIKVAPQMVSFIDWVIIGAQTKPTVYPKIEWVKEIVKACDKAGIPVFLKDNLKPLIDEHYPDESELVPNHNKLVRMEHPYFCPDCVDKCCSACGVIWGLRQEMPKWVKDNLNKSVTSPISIIDGEHYAKGKGQVTGIDAQEPVFIKPGTKSVAEGEGNITATRIAYNKGEQK